jgi:hypothetical protein
MPDSIAVDDVRRDKTIAKITKENKEKGETKQIKRIQNGRGTVRPALARKFQTTTDVHGARHKPYKI